MSFRLARASVRITTEPNSKSFTVRDQNKRLSSTAQQLSDSFHLFEKPIHLLSPLHRSNSHRFVRYDPFIHNEECRTVFKEFLHLSKCEELVLFWEELLSYKECYKQFNLKLINQHGTIYSRGFDMKKKQKMIFNLVDRATFIVNTYLTRNSLLELNLHSKHRVHAPRVIESIQNRLRVEKDVFEIIRETQEETQELLLNILNELNPKFIFGDVEATVNLDLKDQLQSHFLKSELGAKFVKSKGEEFFNNLSKNREQEQVDDEFKDLVFSLSNLKSKLFQNHLICDSLKKNTKLVMFSSKYSSCISDDDIYSAILWERDDSEWTSFHKNYDSSHKYSYNLSLSNSWTISQSFSKFFTPKQDPNSTSFRVGRIDMIIPFERETVFQAFSQPEIRKVIEEALDISLLESYTQDNLEDLDDASDCVSVVADDFSEIIDVSNEKKPKGLFTSKCSMTTQNCSSILHRLEKKKVLDMNQSTLYDSELDCIIHVSKSLVKDSKSDNVSFSHFFFYQDNDSTSDSTYMVHLFNLEKKRIDSKFKMKHTIKSRVKRVKQTFHNYFSKQSDISDLLVRNNDPLYIVNTLLLNKFSNPNRSWYRELLQQTKSVNFQKEMKSNYTLSCESLKNNTSF